MTKKFLGLWDVHKELQDDDPEAIQKLSQKLADEVNAKIKDLEMQKSDAELMEKLEPFIESAVEDEMRIAKIVGVNLNPEDARTGVIEYMRMMFASIAKENAEDAERAQLNSKEDYKLTNFKNIIYTQKIQDAIHFSIEVHQLTGQPQFRKGKAVPYITHPLAVGLILSQAGASEDVVVAGILHDTIEDSDSRHKVTKEMLAERFGEAVAILVDSVTEKDRGLSWHERKELALEEIKQFSHDSLLVKSGDVISNNTELIADYNRDGDKTFERFNAPKEKTIGHTLVVIETIIAGWPENPLVVDLQVIKNNLQSML